VLPLIFRSPAVQGLIYSGHVDAVLPFLGLLQARIVPIQVNFHYLCPLQFKNHVQLLKI
jgi:hypothetical protein